MQLDLGVRLGHDAQQVGDKGVLADERRDGVEFAGAPIAHGDGLDRRPRLDGRLKQPAVEGADAAALAGRALGEQRYALAVFDDLDQGIDGRAEGAEVGAAQKDRPAPLSQPTDDGPGADIVLGEEGGGCGRGDGDDVQPGDVIGDQQTALVHRPAVDVHP